MNPENWQRIEELLNAALEIEPLKRREFLRAISADDVRREIESLLECEPQTDGFLMPSAVAFSTDFFDADSDAPGTLINQQIGSYRILRELGRGGMGAVYLAERADDAFQQQVALKIIRHSFAHADLKRRFQRERQILASLNHPNIARLLDGGMSADGDPFLVMEYVEGERIDRYCDAHNLSVEARLKLFTEVCNAVTYAHQHLVIHRDIKPSNILVTDEGAPKLLDFGIAKLLDAEHDGTQTITEWRAFTPDYAAPEQVRGERVTTAADVYSLGVLLHDLLQGAPPASSAARQFAPGRWLSKSFGQKTTVPNPSTDKEAVRGSGKTSGREGIAPELENIISMARREDPARRYVSAAQLAEDLQRYLDGLPVRAQKDAFTYRAGKFVKRNKIPVLAAALALLSLFAGLAVSLWQTKRAREQRDMATRRFNDVRELSNALLFRIAPKVERLQGATEAREEIVSQSLKYLDSLAQESQDDSALQSELASAYEKIGDIEGNPTNPNKIALQAALTSYEKAGKIRQKLLGKAPRDLEQRRLLANNFRVLGNIHWQTKEVSEAQKNVAAAIRLYTDLLAEQPDSAELRLALGQTYLDVGQNLVDNEKFAEAIPDFQKAIGAAEELRRQYPDKIDILKLLADGHQQLGSALSWNKQQKEGETEMARAIEIYESLVAAHPNDVSFRAGLWKTYWMTSSVYEEQNDKLANEYDLKALQIIRQAVEKDPADLRAKEQLAKTYSHLGVTFANIGKPDESISYLKKAVEMLQEISNNETKNRRFKQNLATALIGLGDAEVKRNDFLNAQNEYERAAAILTELVNADDANFGSLRILALVNNSLAKTHEHLAAQRSGAAQETHRQAAKRNYERALEIYQQLEARNALSNYDRKFVEKTQVALQKYQ